MMEFQSHDPAPDIVPTPDSFDEIEAIPAPLRIRIERGIAAVASDSKTKLRAIHDAITDDLMSGIRTGALETGAVVDFLLDIADGYGINREDAEHTIGTALEDRDPFGELPGGSLTDENGGPISLIPTLIDPCEYPVGLLGNVLGSAAVAIQRVTQCPIEIAAQSVLSVASLAAQAIGDVQMPFGQPRPLSQYFFTLADSGDRKTTADTEANRPLKTYERTLREKYKGELKTYQYARSAWEGQKRKIEADKSLDYSKRLAELELLGTEPVPPLQPFMTAPDPTIEGLIKLWLNAPGSLGLFSAEGGQFTGGHGMSTDHRLKTAAAVCEIWDGKSIRRVRAGDGVHDLHGRRLSMHLLLQPNVAADFFSDPLLRGQGFFSRRPVAAPKSLAGSRMFRRPDSEDVAAIAEYEKTILSLLCADLKTADGRNELTPRNLILSDAAESLWIAFHNEIEGRQGADGDLHPIREFASKAAEHAARIAGVLAVVNNPETDEIDSQRMADAIELTNWYVGETLRLIGASFVRPEVARANRLLTWLQRQSRFQGGFKRRDILQFGPPDCRIKANADSAISILADHGWISGGGTFWRLTDVGAGESQ